MSSPDPSPRRRPRDDVAEHAVVFRFRPPHGTQFVHLRGDLQHWQIGIPLAPQGDERGYWETTVRLPVGTYAYKFRLTDGSWWLDPQNPRTRGVNGSQNSLLVVGGTDEPVLHAPARPDLFIEEDGRLCVRAGLRRGVEGGLVLRWDEGHGPRETAMRVAAVEDEHVLYEAHLPTSSRALEYLFVLGDGRAVGHPGGAGQAFRVTPSRIGPEAPAWWRDAVLYTVFIDRFRKGGTGGAWPETSISAPRAPAHGPPGPAVEELPAGGDIAGIIESLDHLSDIGVTALHLTPITLAASAHRYDTVDPRVVDPRLGGEDALLRLLDAAHRRNLKVILDVPVTHVNRDFFAFQDVRRRGKSSPYWSWFVCYRYPFSEGLDPGYEHYQKGQWREPLLRTENPEVADYLVATFEHWTRLGADGFRVDAAADLPVPLVARIAGAVHAIRRDAVVFGEVIPENLQRFTAAGLDAATDFVAEETLYDWLWRRRIDGRRAAEALALRRFRRGGPGWTTISFSATHDQPRLRSLVGDAARARLGHLLVLLRAAVPAIYYGDEIGLASDSPSGVVGGEFEFERAWADRKSMPWDPAKWDLDTLALFRAALRARKDSTALRRGDEIPLSITITGTITGTGEGANDVLAFRRSAGGEIVDVLLHGNDGDCEISLPGGAPSGARSLVALGDVHIDETRGAVRLGPWSGVALHRVPSSEARATWNEVVTHNRQLGALAFREALVESPALPAHLYLTITESCNIRCAHCITDAPARTREGRARELRPWVLDALSEAFSAADYFAFVHGGESLVAPIFPDVLRAIARARAGRPGRHDVHLLSNGMLLDGERTRRLLDLGLTSVSVSLDGASPRTNDLLRIGSRFDQVVDNLRQVIDVRKKTGADLRVGLSTVVAVSNLTELPALARLCVDIGLDWLKIEEMYPCTLVARQELVAPRDPRLEQLMSEVRAILSSANIVLVDHRDPPSGCACEATNNPTLAAFRAADDFANRASFHPCRMAWEQAAVDPDGTVHAVDYDHPPLGNLLDASFLELWNSPVARELRQAALGRIPTRIRASCQRL